ncbi:MAG TPA: methyltransferase domain-containing protein [Verrucomicrobiae bacterium]|nr:methyltransferase domain-containing protein [Verrucomicrobiae bacterium]
MATTSPAGFDAERLRAQVLATYDRVARDPGGEFHFHRGSRYAVRYLRYDADVLATLPPESTARFAGVGNPLRIGPVHRGETVLDHACGAGMDLLLAARCVGPEGRAIGVDMTPEMLGKARRNTEHYRKETGLDNVEFRLGEIEHLPLADNSVDVVISNCVINLSPDKAQVWREMARVLKPGGRVAVSDMALLKPLPAEILKMVEAMIGCVAGAVLADETARMAREAGLAEVVLSPKTGYIEALTDWEDPLYRKMMEHLPAGTKAADYVTSLEVRARKPARQ